jgi:hypothetical protein
VFPVGIIPIALPVVKNPTATMRRIRIVPQGILFPSLTLRRKVPTLNTREKTPKNTKNPDTTFICEVPFLTSEMYR